MRTHSSHKDYRHKYISNKKPIEIASESLKGRVVETSLTDLDKENKEVDRTFRKIKLIIEDVQGSSCYTNFHSMDVSRDKLCSLISKWQTTIEAFVDVKTKDDYFLRVFAICMTNRSPNQRCVTSYATTSKTKLIRKRMSEMIIGIVKQNTLKQLVPLLLDTEIEKNIKDACAKYYPLKNVLIRKVKILKKPKFDSSKMAELYGEKAGISTEILDIAASGDAQNLITQEAQ